MIYLDHASTTPVDSKVMQAMAPFFTDSFGNPSSLYALGRQAAQAIESARQQISQLLAAERNEIIFTAGGTESDNLAIFGVAEQFFNQAKDYHLITTTIEHPAVLSSFQRLAKIGFQVSYLPVDKFGLVRPGDLMKTLRPNTILVSIIYANNEIGTIEPIAEFSKIVKNYHYIQQINKVSSSAHYPVFHTDACQAAGYLDLDVQKLGVDLMTLNGSKIYGPKQTGLLYKNKNIKINPLFFGGDQEMGFRPGTENVAGIVGFAAALRLAAQNKEKESRRLAKLRDYFIKKLLSIPETMLNGHPIKRLPNNINVTFRRIEGESILLKLDAKGIYCSTGSACHSKSLEPSHVILAIGQSPEDAHGSIRFTLGRDTTKSQIDRVMKILPGIVKELREMTSVAS